MSNRSTPSTHRGIPDLWQTDEADAVRLYEMFLARLMVHDRQERIVEACQAIRHYAAKGPGARAALFCTCHEVHALSVVREYEHAWRRLRKAEEVAFGRRLDLRRWEDAKQVGDTLLYSYAPLLYFCARHEFGRRLLEKSLHRMMMHDTSYHLLGHVWNSEEEPDDIYRVTLRHFYQRLGRSLDSWNDWPLFVKGFHPRLFRLSGISRDALFADPTLLAAFSDRLSRIRDERVISGVARGQNDLIQSEVKVRQWQEKTARKLEESDLESRRTRRERERTLQSWFPELAELPETEA